MSATSVEAIFAKSERARYFWTRVTQFEVADFSLRGDVLSLSRSAGKRSLQTWDNDYPPMLELEGRLVPQEANVGTSLIVTLSRLQILVLPSLVNSLYMFKQDLSSWLPSTQVEGKQRSTTLAIGKPLDVHISALVDSLEILLPTKDVAKAMREDGTGGIGVVAIRCGFEIRSKLSVEGIETLLSMPLFDSISSEQTKACMEEFVTMRIRQNDGGSVAASSTHVRLRDLQLLRTTMAIPSSFPITFNASAASSREERISNSFTVAFHHEAVATAMQSSSPGKHAQKICVAQVLEVKCGVVDVLLYVARSDKGIHAAIESTVRPIQHILLAKGRHVVHQKKYCRIVQTY